ncbi:maleylacetate reductase [Allokutzneria sp. A3M-2-11 16]|uniref:maleylacetate reductase n=1 Tax=Allokutzneria sp. A3M-2-11 16 TaxID=2962043 RepID=UPI0020B6F0B0|nr:maleylacetate reductase [Allokutzneria sp. A3M-2-11 16]MCP3805194.1 maleylacetate reductase [Allokutzneria sp. A3M-2-11 16]
MRAFRYESLPGRVVFGVDSALTVAEEISGQRVLVLATPRGLPLARSLAEPLGDRVAGEFTSVREHVPVAVASQAVEVARSVGADCLLAIGGGSTVGTAKAIALELRLPIVAVPTTYAGSEMTPVWGMTSPSGKRTGRSLDVLPAVVVYDPSLTVGLPRTLTVTSAMNAMAHSVEGVYAAGANPISSLMAEESVRALAKGLVAADDVEARTSLLYGAYLAGAVFAVAGSGLHHKICHVLGGAYDLPHAATHTVVLPHVAEFMDGPALAPIASALNAPTAADGLRALARRVDAPTSLADIGFTPANLSEAAALVAAQVDVPEPRVRALLASAL